MTGGSATPNNGEDVPAEEESDSQIGLTEPEAQTSASNPTSGSQYTLLAVIGWLVLDTAVGVMR